MYGHSNAILQYIMQNLLYESGVILIFEDICLYIANRLYYNIENGSEW